MSSSVAICRRLPLVIMGLVCGLGSVACGGPPEPTSIVLVTIDTIRADRLGAYGYFRDTSPNLDRLAADAVLFERPVTPMATTLPAHVSLMTSLYPIQHGVRGNFQHLGRALETGERLHSLAQILERNGWETAAFVGATPLKRDSGIAAGFTTFDQPANQSRRAGVVIDRALAWLEERSRAPFFLWAHLWDPHHPYAPPPEFERAFDGAEDITTWMEERGFSGVNDPSVVRQNNDYDDEIRYVDSEIGRLIAALERLEIYDDLALVVTGDHGEGLGQHDWLRHGRIYNEELVVPLLMRFPARLGLNGRRRGELVSLIDVVPTLAGRLDLPLTEEEGRQLQGMDLLAGKRSRPYVFAERVYRSRTPWEEGEKYALVSDQWKYFHLPEAADQLFHLAEDPFELIDVIDEYPEIAEQMGARLEALRAELARTALDIAGNELSSERRRELEALGYVE